jgi:hypothetical protein
MKFSAKSGDLKFSSRRFAKMSCTSYIWTAMFFFIMLLKYTNMYVIVSIYSMWAAPSSMDQGAAQFTVEASNELVKPAARLVVIEFQPFQLS